jgi:internalin A
MIQSELLAIIDRAASNGWAELDLSWKGLIEIPEEISSLFHLRRINLRGNQIKEIPNSLHKLSNLREIDLRGNQFREIPEVIFRLSNLTSLYLSHNQIREIPDTVSNLSTLTLLYLSHNQIRKVSEIIFNLSSLTTLDLSSNHITQIPDKISNLSNLTTLDLSSNYIKEISDAIFNLSSLTTLDLSSNHITQIPNKISNLSNLTTLDLSSNHITQIPIEILNSRNIKDLFNYLDQLYMNGTRPLHEAKLLLIGQGSVGKTSLIERLINNHYDTNQPQTDGLNIETWKVNVNSKDIRLNVWDFGGQEIYHATHQFFLTKRSLYLLVCNCRTSEEENRIEYWLKLIESFGDKSPVIIVGNKKDEQPLDINRKALREKYPNIQAIIETSCQDNIGIDELRAAVLNQVGNLKEVYDLLPLSWFEVKQQLEAMTEDFISYNRYIGICHENKIPEEHSQEQLIDLLHRLGLVLNFRDHPILKGTNVLKPEWVTEGIYKLLSDDILKTENKGIFALVDLNRILDLDRYPRERHHYLIELMQEFKLCFTIDCHPPKFLIPAILPKDEPQNTRLPDDILEFQYHYRILPNSIISRFIVNTSDYIHKQTYWRSGVMLAYPESGEVYNIARIKADTEDKKIFITISGRKETRREFLAIIRKEFNKIHKNFSNLDITEWVTIPEYPNIDPLNYQDLLITEDSGESTVFVAKIRQKIDISKLLDGYASKQARQEQVYIEKQINYYQYGQGDNFAGDEVEGNKIG